MKTLLALYAACLTAICPSVSCAAELVVPADVLFERDIEYSNPDGQHLQLNLARPKNANGALPAVLCIHGGGFRAGSRDGHNALCLKLAQRGFVAATVSYRLAPKYQFPAAVHDVKAAVRWVRANAAKYQIDPARIGVTGDSAGGHLAQFLGVTAGVKEFEGESGNADQSSSVTCVVNRFGPSDFTKSYGKSVDAAEVLPLFLGGDLQTARQRHVRSSPLNWVTPNAAPTLLLHGTEDKYVAYEQGVWMRDRLAACGVEVELVTFAGAGHGFKGADAERADQAMFAFFEKHLKATANASPSASAGVTNTNLDATPTIEVAQSLVVTHDLAFGAKPPSVAEAMRDIERRYQPDDGRGRTFAILEAFGGEVQPDGKLRLSLRVSTEKPGGGEIVFRRTGQVLWKSRIIAGTHKSSFNATALTILFDNGAGKVFTVDGSKNPPSILEAGLKEPGIPVSQAWPDGAERELSILYSACGCPVKVRCRRTGDRTMRVSTTQTIFPDDPAVVAILSRLMRW